MSDCYWTTQAVSRSFSLIAVLERLLNKRWHILDKLFIYNIYIICILLCTLFIYEYLYIYLFIFISITLNHRRPVLKAKHLHRRRKKSRWIMKSCSFFMANFASATKLLKRKEVTLIRNTRTVCKPGNYNSFAATALRAWNSLQTSDEKAQRWRGKIKKIKLLNLYVNF